MPLIEWISYILTLSGLFVIIGFVGAKNYRSPINQKFIFFAVSVIAYIGSSFMSEIARPLSSALFWTRTALFAANFIPLAFFAFTLEFTGYKLKHKWVKTLMYISPFVIAPISYLPGSITTVKYDTFGTTIDQTGLLLLLSMVYLVTAFGISFWILYKKAKSSPAPDGAQIRLIIYGVGSAVAINIITQIILSEVNITVFGDLVGTPSNILLVGAVGYAIVRHRMFDIKSAVLRSLVYILGIITVIFFYGLAVYFITSVIVKDFTLPLSLALYFISSSIILALTFPITLHIYQKVTDKLFYRDRYDPQELLNTLSRVLAGTIILEDLSGEVLKILVDRLKITRADLIITNENQIYFASNGIPLEEIKYIYPALGQFDEKITIIDTVELGARRQFLDTYQITALVRLETKQRLVGYLLLGDKLSGYIYNSVDISVLDTVSTELAVAVENAISYSKISHFNETLKVRIAQATKELSSANVKLKQLDIAKDEFISMASHQLRTPISVIGGYISLLLDNVYSNDRDKYEITLKKALQSATHMGALVNDLLNVSRMDAGRFYLDKRPVDINKIIEEEIEQLQFKANRNKVKLTYNPSPKPVPITMLDEEKTRQAIMNLIDNAIAYSPEGQVRVELGMQGMTMVFRVVDNGIGVSDKEKTKLFSRFFRAENAQKVRPDGTGLGLYLVKRVVEDQGGSIIFESQRGKGSTFGFRLPVQPMSLLKPQTDPKNINRNKPINV